MPDRQNPIRRQSELMAWVYIVQNPRAQFYVGMATDLDQRVHDHNDGISKWTKHRGPLEFGVEPGMRNNR
jgi:predicted GIY-YIG superfamily endonuclease